MQQNNQLAEKGGGLWPTAKFNATKSEVKPSRLLLVGAGHGHLHLLVRAERLRVAGYAVTFVDPGDFWYSGLAPAVLGGSFDDEAGRVDIAQLCARNGVHFIRAKMAGLVQGGWEIRLSDGTCVPFDILSLNVGSQVQLPFPVNAPDRLFTAKPIARLRGLKTALFAKWDQGKAARVAVIGGGASGCELACNVAGLARRHRAKIDLMILDRNSEPMAKSPLPVRRHMQHALSDFGIHFCKNTSVKAQHHGFVELQNGGSCQVDFSLVATGLVAPSWLQDLGLSVDPKRGMRVHSTLQSVDHPAIFGIGDCVDIADFGLPKVGVFGVRAGPLLYRNILALACNGPLNDFVPQKRWLAAQNLGDGTGLIWWDSRHGARFCPAWRSPLALQIKNGIDFRFMRQFKKME